MSKKIIKTNWDYSSLAKNYDLRADYSEKLINKILKKIKCKNYFPVADIGAGTGKLTKLLLKRNLIVNAVEPNKNMRFYGEKNTKFFLNVNWSTGTAEETTLKTNSIYCCFFGSSFNVINYKKTFKEIKRVLIDKGFFCCMWNHRDLNNVHQREIEKIIKFHIPNYQYGDRRIDYTKLLSRKNSLTGVKKITQRFISKIKKNDFINAWKSHGTLLRNCKNKYQFNSIIKSIAIYVNSLKKSYVDVPYDNVAYIARFK